MSDFDQYFAERLDQEGQFPNREKNWKTMSKRLDAFDAGIRGYTSHLRYWQTAAAISVVAMSLLFGKMHQMHRDIAKLQGLIAGIQQANQAPGRASAPTIIPPERNDGGSPASLDGGQPFGLKWYSIPYAPIQYPSTEPLWMPRQNSAGGHAPIPFAGSDNTVYTQSTEPGSISEAGTGAGERVQAPLLPLPVSPGQTEKKQVPPVAVSVQPTPIKPVRHNFSKFRLGVQTLQGLPKPGGQGISPLKGAGVTGEYTLLPNLRLSASADWMRHEINSDTFMEQQHFPHTHPKPKFGYRLSNVEGSQRSQYYTLGVSYTLPVRFTLRPVLRVAHTWVHWSASLYNFDFEKKWAFFPPYVAKHDYEPQKSDSEWLKNNWRFGAGLEYETSRWVVGLSADYSTNTTANDPVFDILFLRAGLQYKFD